MIESYSQEELLTSMVGMKGMVDLLQATRLTEEQTAIVISLNTSIDILSGKITALSRLEKDDAK